jgi:mRNA interferase MazF
LYRVRRPSARDPRQSRVFVIVSRQASLDSAFATAICAPVYSARHGLSTQVPVGPGEGLKHDSSVFCDELMSLEKNKLTDFVGELSPARLAELDTALAIAVGLG